MDEFPNLEYLSILGHLEHLFCKRTQRKSMGWIQMTKLKLHKPGKEMGLHANWKRMVPQE